MNRYRVRVSVWIQDMEIEADNAEEAKNKALEMVTNGDVKVWAEHAEVQGNIWREMEILQQGRHT